MIYPLSLWERAGAERCGSRCACAHLDSVKKPRLCWAAVCKTGLAVQKLLKHVFLAIYLNKYESNSS